MTPIRSKPLPADVQVVSQTVRSRATSGFTCSILIPYRPENERRAAIGQWQWGYLARTFPGVQLIRCDDGSTDGPFNRSRALNRCRAIATGTVLWCLDCDAAPQPDDLPTIVAALTERAWLPPYETARLLSEPDTAAILAGADPVTYDGRPQGTAYGLVAMTATTWDAVGGWDESYVGWGFEDLDIALRLRQSHGDSEPVLPHVLTLSHPRPAVELDPLVRLNHDRYAALLRR